MSTEPIETGYWSCARCGGPVRGGTYTMNDTMFCSEHGVKLSWVSTAPFYENIDTEKLFDWSKAMDWVAMQTLKIGPDDAYISSTKVVEAPVLVEAQRLIHGDREREYAPPAKSFLTIADYWTTYLTSRGLLPNDGLPGLTATDVANMMILLKVARTMSGTYKRDTYVDIAGYAGCAERVHNESE